MNIAVLKENAVYYTISPDKNWSDPSICQFKRCGAEFGINPVILENIIGGELSVALKDSKRSADPYLCGGVFFSLLVEARHPSTDFRTNPEILHALLDSTDLPGYSDKTISTQMCSFYKSCRENSLYLFSVDQISTAFRNHPDDFKINLEKMNRLTQALFNDRMLSVVNDAKELVKRLLHIIYSDHGNPEIPVDYEFRLNEYDICTKSSPLDTQRKYEVNLPIFLADIWRFILLYRPINTLGKDYYEAGWRSQTGSGNARRVFCGEVNDRVRSLDFHIVLHLPDPDPEPIDDHLSSDGLTSFLNCFSEGVYNQTWQPEKFWEIFSVLYCAYEPLPLEWLVQQFDAELIKKIIRNCSEWVHVTDGLISLNPTAHEQIKAILSEPQCRIDEQVGHHILGQLCSGNHRYALRHRVAHHLAAGDLEDASKSLMDFFFQSSRQEKGNLGKEATVQAYLEELEQLSDKNEELAKEVMKSPYFQLILSENREFLFRSGGFFQLRRCGYQWIIEETDPDGWNPELIAAVALFLYATARYEDAIPYLNKALEHNPKDEIELQAMLGLCWLKNIELDKATQAYTNVLKSSAGPVELADSRINLGRIACYEQEDGWWENAQGSFCEGLAELEEEIRLQNLLDPKAARQLKTVLAERYRIAALAALFAPDWDLAKGWMDKANTIYEKELENKGRYYIRTKTLQAVLPLFGKDSSTVEKQHACLAKADEALKSLHNQGYIIKDFEEIGMAFWRGVIAYKLGQLEDAQGHLGKAITTANGIGSWVELAEAAAVLDLVNGTTSLTGSLIKSCNGKKHLQRWGHHVASVIDMISSGFQELPSEMTSEKDR